MMREHCRKSVKSKQKQWYEQNNVSLCFLLCQTAKEHCRKCVMSTAELGLPSHFVSVACHTFHFLSCFVSYLVTRLCYFSCFCPLFACHQIRQFADQIREKVVGLYIDDEALEKTAGFVGFNKVFINTRYLNPSWRRIAAETSDVYRVLRT